MENQPHKIKSNQARQTAISATMTALIAVFPLLASCEKASPIPVASLYNAHAPLALTFPDDDHRLADPHVIKVDQSWYMYGTRTGRDLEVWVSEDLDSWNYGGIVWQPTTGTWNDHDSHNIWAPHVEVTDEGYYIYYSANGRVGVAISDSPTGKFEEVFDRPLAGGGEARIGDGIYESADYDVGSESDVLTDAEEYAIDAFVLKKEDGELVFYCSVLNPTSEIIAIPMKSYTELEDVDPVVVLGQENADSWELLNREGAWVIEHGDRFYLMYSGNFWWTPDYSVGVAVGETPFGPFNRSPDNPLLTKVPDVGIYSTGHHSVVEGWRPGDMLMFYHSRTDKNRETPRLPRYVPIEFNSDDELMLSVPLADFQPD